MKNDNTRTQKSHVSSNKKMAIILTTVLLIVMTVGLLLAFLLPGKGNYVPEGDNNARTEIEKSNETNDTLIGVDSDFSFFVTSKLTASYVKTNITIKDQLGKPVQFDVAKDGNTFSVLAPKERYIAGYTYKVILLDEGIVFKDKTYSAKRDITFSIHKEKIAKIVPKEEIKKIVSATIYLYDEHAGEIIIDKATYSKYNLCVGDLVSLPIFDNGFRSEKMYRIDKTTDVYNGIKLSVTVPALEDVYSELEIFDEFEAEYVDDNFIFYDEAAVADQLSQDPVVMDIGRALKSKPKFSLEVKLLLAKVEIEIKIEFPDVNISPDVKINLQIESTFSVALGTIANIDIWKGTFDLGASVKIENEMKVAFVAETEDGEKEKSVEEEIKALEEKLNDTVKERSTSVKAFKTNMPTPVPGLGFSFDIELVFEINLKAEIGVTVKNEFEVKVGVKKDSDGLSEYYNKSSKCDATEVEVVGTVEVKVGVEVKFAASFCGIVNAGVGFEIGGYAKLTGSYKISSINEIDFEGEEFNDDGPSVALYLELGVYSSLSVFAEIDLWLWAAEIKLTFLDIEIPIFSIGRTMYSTVSPESNTVTLDQSGSIEIPNMILTTEDMISGKTRSKTIDSSAVDNSFVFKQDSKENYHVKDNKVVSNSDAEAEFEDDLTLQLKDWSRDELEYDNLDFETETKRGLFHYEVRVRKVVTTIHITKKPIFIESVKLEFDQVTYDPEYNDLYGFSANYNVRNNGKSGYDDYQIGRMVSVYPIMNPTNASYQTLNYLIVDGGEYIQDFKQFIVNGVSKASFRIKCDEAIIGREIKIKAVSTGYVGKYGDKNVQTDAHDKVVASNIPAERFKFNSVVEGEYVNVYNARSGDIIDVGIDGNSVVPKNATRGELGFESISIVSGSAKFMQSEIDKTMRIKFSSDSKVGSQVIVSAKIANVEKLITFNIIKQAVDTVEISTAFSGNVIPETEIEINAEVLDINGGKPSISEVMYLIIEGNKISSIYADRLDKNRTTLVVDKNAKENDVITIIAFVDGVISNELTFVVGKIKVESIEIKTENEVVIASRGDQLQMLAEILPEESTYKDVKYSITSGSEYVTLDEYLGILKINFSCVGDEVITIVATVDGVQSNILTITVERTSVQEIRFDTMAIAQYVSDGQQIELKAYVNSNATNQNIIYSILSGSNFAAINDNILTINSGLIADDEIVVRAASAENSAIYIDKKYVIYNEIGEMSINGEYDMVELLADCSLHNATSYDIVITDIEGNVVPNSNMEFTVLNANDITSDTVFVSDDGKISFEYTTIFDSEQSISIYARDKLTRTQKVIHVVIVLPMEVHEVVIDSGERELYVNPNGDFSLDIVFRQDDLASTALYIYDVRVVVEGNAYAEIVTTSLGQGNKSYAVYGRLNANADYYDKAYIKVGYYILGQYYEIPKFTIIVNDNIENIDLINVPESVNIGECVMLDYLITPFIRSDEVEFILHNQYGGDFVQLDSKTGKFEVFDNRAYYGIKIQVSVKIRHFTSPKYEILITDNITDIIIAGSKYSTGVEVIGNNYYMYPDGKLEINPTYEGALGIDTITYTLDAIGSKYFTITDNIITVKNVAANSSLNGTLTASCNGLISNTMSIYALQLIRTVEQWNNISLNTAGNYVLMNNINFVGHEYTPLEIFTGIIIGQNYILRNIKINDVSIDNNIGLIEVNRGLIMEVAIQYMEIDLSRKHDDKVYIGGIAARNYGSIIDCVSTSAGHIGYDARFNNVVVGGLVGQNYGIISGSTSNINISTLGQASGIAGENHVGGKIIDCTNYGFIEVDKYDYENAVKGIAAWNEGVITNCKDRGDIYDISTGKRV